MPRGRVVAGSPGGAYAEVGGFMHAHGLADEDVSDPGSVPEADLITNVVLPVK